MGDKEGNCHLDGMSRYVWPCPVRPSVMTGYERSSQNRSCRSTGESGTDETVVIGSQAVQEVGGRGAVDGSAGGQSWPHYW